MEQISERIVLTRIDVDEASYRTASSERIKGIIEALVSHIFCVSTADLLSPSRGCAQVALARQVAMYLAHVVGRLQLTEIGRAFGRDRTTVAYACAVVESRRDDPTFNRTVDLCEGIVLRLFEIMLPPRTRIA